MEATTTNDNATSETATAVSVVYTDSVGEYPPLIKRMDNVTENNSTSSDNTILEFVPFEQSTSKTNSNNEYIPIHLRNNANTQPSPNEVEQIKKDQKGFGNRDRQKRKQKKEELIKRFGTSQPKKYEKIGNQLAEHFNIERTKGERKRLSERDRRFQHRKQLRSKRSKELIDFNTKVSLIMGEAMTETFDLRLAIRKLSQLIIEYNKHLLTSIAETNANNLLNPFIMSDLNLSFAELSLVVQNINKFVDKYYENLSEARTNESTN